MRQLLLRHRVEHVALILGRIERLFQNEFPVLLLNPRIVPSRDMIAAEDLRPLIEPVKFHEPVAVDAGVRRPPGLIALGEAADDLVPEIVREIEHIIRHPEPVGHAPRVLHIVE